MWGERDKRIFFRYNKIIIKGCLVIIVNRGLKVVYKTHYRKHLNGNLFHSMLREGIRPFDINVT